MSAAAPTTTAASGRRFGQITRDSVPSRRDPRWPFALILTTYGVLGFTLFGFNRTPIQMFLTVAAGMALEVVLALVVRKRLVFPLSAYISCCSLALLLNYSHQNWLLFLPVFLAVGSKYMFTFERRHIFNPSMFGVATSLLFAGQLITAAPAYQWAGGDITLSAFIIMAALSLFVFRIGKNWLIFSFLGFYALQTLARAWFLRHHIPPEMMFLGTLMAPPFFIFTFYMITDPATSPKTPRGQVLFALALTLVDLYLHVYESVFTFFYAALALASAKYLFLHGRALVRGGLKPYLAAWSSWEVMRGPALTGAIGIVMISSYVLVISPNVHVHEPGFTMTRIAPQHSGLGTTMGQVFEQTDPRVQHVAKWVLSVGGAVATADVDGDGLMDLFFTHPLQAAPDRAVLYRNLGDMRFERVEVPALARYHSDDQLKHYGLAGGATFVDFDGDGDIDLFIAGAFGPSMMLRNDLKETGTFGFTDVTEALGLSEHHVSIAAVFLDIDRDARLDLFVANALTTHLPDYDTPTPLNIFNLPKPEHPGDRRALRFMHNGWHNADNGGVNHVYRANPDGRFERLDLGMTETRWSLAVCTLDVNHDGYTDLYVANDFGPDRLYLNKQGEGFESVISARYGDIGKDTYKGMNCSSADFDRNGYQDIYVSNVHQPLQAEGSLLWMVRPNPDDPMRPLFSDEATVRGALNEQRFAWGAAAGDLNNDGWPDLVQANGMVDDRLDPKGYDRKDYWYVNHKLMQSGPELHTYADMWGDIRGRTIFPNEARRAMLNLGDRAPGYFADVAAQIGVDDPDNSRGVALVDLDNDGDLDLVITNQHGDPSLYRNALRDGTARDVAHQFIGLTLIGDGTRTHRSAIGSRVRALIPGQDPERAQWREVTTLTGFSGQSDGRLHFGLGHYDGPVELEIHWYGAQVQRVSLPAGQYHSVEQAP